jgi:hypothetical protein
LPFYLTSRLPQTDLRLWLASEWRLPFASALGRPSVCSASILRKWLADFLVNLGAYFASRPLPPAFNTWGYELNVYAVPAILTLILLVLETIFLAVALPETRGIRFTPAGKQKPSPIVDSANPAVKSKGASSGKLSVEASLKGRISTIKKRIDTLKKLRRLHFLFLGVFSGVEFTLTFLTFDRKPINLPG